jgi:hypothetical protein
MVLVIAIFVANGTFAIGVGIATVFCVAGVRFPEYRYLAVLLANAAVFIASSLLALKPSQRVEH